VVPAGTVKFLGQDIPRALLEREGKVKAVIYNGADRIYAGDRVFLVSLGDFSADYDAVDIPAALQTEADEIVASVVTFESSVALATPTPIPTRVPPTPIPATATSIPATLVAGADGANVRSGPGTNYPRLAHLDPGTEVPVVGRYGDWWQVEYDGTLAWIADRVVTARNVEGVPEIQLTPSPGASPPTAGRAPASHGWDSSTLVRRPLSSADTGIGGRLNTAAPRPGSLLSSLRPTTPIGFRRHHRPPRRSLLVRNLFPQRLRPRRLTKRAGSTCT